MKKFIFIFVLILHLIFNIDNCISQWVKQNWPTFETVYGVNFLDINTGFVAGKTFPVNYDILYRTTNGGYNWNISIWPYRIGLIQKIDSTTEFMWAVDRAPNGGNNLFYWTTNKGNSWDSTNYGYTGYMGMYFINRDTGWAAIFDGNYQKYFITTNGGNSFSLLYSHLSSGYVTKMFFLKEKYNGNFVGYRTVYDLIKKTTDGGYNWIDLPALPIVPQYDKNGKLLTQPDITQITFINKDTGWVSNGTKNVYYTNNGGNNWIIQSLPYDINFRFYGFGGISIINRDTIYADFGSYYFGNNRYRGIIFKTTNGGNNWGYQLPDTSMNPISVDGFYAPSFINGLTGWFTNIHTTNGGGPIIFTEIKNISVEHPTEYKLMQNYPNPFNPSTSVDFTCRGIQKFICRFMILRGV